MESIRKGAGSAADYPPGSTKPDAKELGLILSGLKRTYMEKMRVKSLTDEQLAALTAQAEERLERTRQNASETRPAASLSEEDQQRLIDEQNEQIRRNAQRARSGAAFTEKSIAVGSNDQETAALILEEIKAREEQSLKPGESADDAAADFLSRIGRAAPVKKAQQPPQSGSGFGEKFARFFKRSE